jgi:hypothetical protein
MPSDSIKDDGRDGMPLRAEVKDGCLYIAIGEKTLAFAFENSDFNNPFDDALGDFEKTCHVSDPAQFAEDVCLELNREDEDGSTPLTRFLDSMMQEAFYQGSLGIHDPEEDEDEEGEEYADAE